MTASRRNWALLATISIGVCFVTTSCASPRPRVDARTDGAAGPTEQSSPSTGVSGSSTALPTAAPEPSAPVDAPARPLAESNGIETAAETGVPLSSEPAAPAAPSLVVAAPGTPLSEAQLGDVYESMRQDIRDGDLELGLRRYSAIRSALSIHADDPRREIASDIELLARFIEKMLEARSVPGK